MQQEHAIRCFENTEPGTIWIIHHPNDSEQRAMYDTVTEWAMKQPGKVVSVRQVIFIPSHRTKVMLDKTYENPTYFVDTIADVADHMKDADIIVVNKFDLINESSYPTFFGSIKTEAKIFITTSSGFCNTSGKLLRSQGYIVNEYDALRNISYGSLLPALNTLQQEELNRFINNPLRSFTEVTGARQTGRTTVIMHAIEWIRRSHPDKQTHVLVGGSQSRARFLKDSMVQPNKNISFCHLQEYRSSMKPDFVLIDDGNLFSDEEWDSIIEHMCGPTTKMLVVSGGYDIQKKLMNWSNIKIHSRL